MSLLLTVLFLIGNGFFVASEFALVAARRPRLERQAAHGSSAARAALDGIDELSLMLAGAQLGITLCSLGLGVVSEPVIAGTLVPLFHTLGLPEAAAHGVAFVIALAIVTFLHMVVGEMAPKSWAIAHPERSAMLVALPFRGFTVVVRPLLAALNGVTNGLLRLFGVRQAAGETRPRTPEQLRHLVEESRRLGLIEPEDHAVLTQTLRAPETAIADLITPAAEIAGVRGDATAEQIVDACARTGRTRLVVWPAGVVHLRDAYLARRRGRRVTAERLAYPAPRLAADASVAHAVSAMRAARSQLALVEERDGKLIGLVSLDTLLTTLLVPG
ncbi:hemolysin family protein [Nonomuraea sediminis]|uniref:hemolysin family protein n=1 Tax=Nonomuraea sediminis TaxID=2835864 RepID=UPI001BDCB93E|nr:hemolysin family protein [Nonomuraea sediminis]